MGIKKLQEINSITKMIIELKMQPSSVETKKTIQRLQQRLDNIIKEKNEL